MLQFSKSRAWRELAVAASSLYRPDRLKFECQLTMMLIVCAATALYLSTAKIYIWYDVSETLDEVNLV